MKSPTQTTTARTRDAATARKPAEAENLPAKTGGPALPAHLQTALVTDAGQGVSMDQADSMVPLIYILQTNSPQVNERDPAYIEGARPGCLWLRNAPTPIVDGKQGPLVQPCYFYKEVVEWGPKRGDGFIARHDHNPKHPQGMPDDAVPGKNDEGKDIMTNPRGTVYVETRCHVVLVHDPDGINDPVPYVFPLTGSGHTPSRQWTFMMRNKTVGGKVLPSYAMLYRLPTVQRKNSQGSWFMINPMDAGTVAEPAYADERQYALGKALHEAFATGAKRAEAPQEPGTETSGGADDTMRRGEEAGV